MRRPKFIAAAALVASALSIVTTPVAPALPAAADDADFLILYFPQPHPATRFWNDFGNPRSGGRRHQGTDLLGDRMWPVAAVAGGTIFRKDHSPRAGYHIYIEHADGWESWYMHLNNDTPGTDDGDGGEEFAFATDLEVGDIVEPGQIIGWVGDSGNAEGGTPHTHFELHHGDRIKNPYRYLHDAWERQLRLWDLADLVA